MLAAVARPRFVLHGTGGAYVKHGFDVQERKLRGGRIPWDEKPSESEQEESSGVLTIVNADATTAQQRVPPVSSDSRSYYANIRDALLGRAAPAVTPQDALNVMRVLEF